MQVFLGVPSGSLWGKDWKCEPEWKVWKASRANQEAFQNSAPHSEILSTKQEYFFPLWFTLKGTCAFMPTVGVHVRNRYTPAWHSEPAFTFSPTGAAASSPATRLARAAILKWLGAVLLFWFWGVFVVSVLVFLVLLFRQLVYGWELWKE